MSYLRAPVDDGEEVLDDGHLLEPRHHLAYLLQPHLPLLHLQVLSYTDTEVRISKDCNSCGNRMAIE